MAWGVRVRNAETDRKAMRVSEQVILGPGQDVGEMFFHSCPISLPLQDPRIPSSYRPRFVYGQAALRKEAIMFNVPGLLC